MHWFLTVRFWPFLTSSKKPLVTFFKNWNAKSLSLEKSLHPVKRWTLFETSGVMLIGKTIEEIIFKKVDPDA